MFLATTATFLAAFLTIVISNLYSVASYDHASHFNASTTDSFNGTWDHSKGDNNAGVYFSLCDGYNVSYPALTFDELAFPNFTYPPKVANFSVDSLTDETGAAMTLPAYRAALNCSFAPDNAIVVDMDSFEWDNGNGTGYYLKLNYTLEVPGHCVNVSSPKTSYSFHNPYSVIFYNVDDAGTYADASWVWMPFQYADGQVADACFSLGFMLGRFTFNATSPVNVSIMFCNQTIEEVNVSATWLLPSMTIDGTQNVSVHEESKRILDGGASFDLEAILVDTGPFPTMERSSDLVSENIETFHAHVLWGTDGVPLENLVGDANEARYFDAAQRTYRRYMAQVISRNMRQPVDSASQRTIQAETPYTGGALRLVQNRGPKITLQVLLGLISICALTGALMTPMHRVLPHNPLTIAGLSSYLAGGRLCSSGMLPENIKDLSKKKELDSRFEKYQFTFGWFEQLSDDKTVGRFGIDVQPAVDDEA